MPVYICPHCKNPIYDDDALLCLYCGESLRRPVGFFGKLRYPRPAVIIAFLALIILLSFMALVIF
ncbi:MAG: hypothetical protein PHW98_03060 [Candidatus Omnitrophica bacterium]|nr:hypothetical protein [Candidatus Omnitrophota bacterium]MDD5771252.1 hypothetical protein [Candidatus Omnitrophota bacterium]